METRNEDTNSDRKPVWQFVLYRAGLTQAGEQAEAMLRTLCDRYVPERYRIEIVDIKTTSAVVPTNVLAVPTVVRTIPLPEKRVIGDLSNVLKASEGLGFDEAEHTE